MSLFAALTVFAATLYLVIARPWKLSIALGAALGAVAALLLSEASLFRFMALHLANWAAGRSGRLFAADCVRRGADPDADCLRAFVRIDA